MFAACIVNIKSNSLNKIRNASAESPRNPYIVSPRSAEESDKQKSNNTETLADETRP